ncbi:MAG: hypothetical protein AAGA93_11325 [Actinomycetota bacterium]
MDPLNDVIDGLLREPTILDDAGDVGVAFVIGIVVSTIVCGSTAIGSIEAMRDTGDAVPAVSFSLGAIIGLQWLAGFLSEDSERLARAMSDSPGIALAVFPIAAGTLYSDRFGLAPDRLDRHAERRDVVRHWIRVGVLTFLLVYLLELLWWAESGRLAFLEPGFAAAGRTIIVLQLVGLAASIVSLAYAYVYRATSREHA